MAGTSVRSLSALIQRTGLDDHEEILNACNAALNKSKSDIDARHVKVVALLKLDRYEDALRVYTEGDEELKTKAPLERAYALYKTGDLEEAEKIAAGIETHRGARHLEAQTAYRLEDFEKSARIYKQLFQNAGDEESDIRINKSAVEAQLEWQGKGDVAERKKVDREDLEAFETTYNAACACIARGELEQAGILLRRARDLCDDLDELSENEKTAELLPIKVQELLVLVKLGKLEDAEQLAASIPIQSISDASTRTIAQSNIALSKPSNCYETYTLLHNATTLPKSDRLFTFQSTLQTLNSHALDLLVSKPQAVLKSTSRFLSAHDSPSLDAFTGLMSILNAAAYTTLHASNRQNQCQDPNSPAATRKVAALLTNLVSARPLDVGLRLTLIQLYVQLRDHTSAVSTFESFVRLLDASTTPETAEVRFAPALLAVSTSLYALQHRQTAIANACFEFASHWLSEPASRARTAVLRFCGPNLLKSTVSTHQDFANRTFVTLHEEFPDDKFIISGLIASSPGTAAAMSLVSELPPISSLLPPSVSASVLSEAGIPAAPSRVSGSVLKRSAADAAEGETKKRRVRSARIPKDYDATKKVDPERWLPQRERSGWRPKKGKRSKRRGDERMQGGLPTEEKEDKNKNKATGQGQGGKRKKGKGRR